MDAGTAAAVVAAMVPTAGLHAKAARVLAPHVARALAWKVDRMAVASVAAKAGRAAQKASQRVSIAAAKTVKPGNPANPAAKAAMVAAATTVAMQLRQTPMPLPTPCWQHQRCQLIRQKPLRHSAVSVVPAMTTVAASQVSILSMPVHRFTTLSPSKR